MILSRAIVRTPIGDMLALASEEGLCALEFTTVEGPGSGQGRNERLSRLEGRLARWFPRHQIVDSHTATIARADEWLAAYFAGTAADIAGIPLDMRGAPFEQRVWAALRTIPPGETTSYGAIARAVGSPSASRAVGAANGANPIAIIVPCHRVIGSTGSLTGYGGGLDRKTWLIDHERRWRTDQQASLF
jgi:methylated-DNA-[protein]-cysteine S-methyltransferase